LAKAEGFARPPVALSRVALQNEAISDIGFALRDIKAEGFARPPVALSGVARARSPILRK
jgi:hypothetical protein